MRESGSREINERANSAPLIDSKIEKKAYIVGRGQTWHRPEDVEAALDKSLEDLGLGYGKYETLTECLLQ